MLTVVIGHRGAGKSQWLQRLKQDPNKSQALFFDLDQEIEKRISASILEIFKNKGVKEFRKIESTIFSEICNSHISKECFIAVGAGFEGDIPKQARCVWLRNLTDPDGRIFLDRPRLTEEESAWSEYFIKYKERNPRYQKLSHEQVIVSGAYQELCSADQLYFTSAQGSLGGCLTLTSENFKSPQVWQQFVERRLKWGVDYFEIREDLLSEENQRLALASLPPEKIIYSRRLEKEEFKNENGVLVDWALELGDPEASVDIVSLHQRSSSLEETFERINQFSGHKKLAIPIYNTDELMQGHKWYLEDPVNRSFLPRSQKGRWSWYRLIHKNKMKINYFREAEGSSLDQPLFYDWANTSHKMDEFAAIMGSPVHHSRTPIEQKQYFQNLDLPVIRIELDEEDTHSALLNQLQDLGLRYAAVTSPLKREIFHKTHFEDKKLQHLESANTLYWSSKNKSFLSTNTDVAGLKRLLSGKDPKTISVWGGGGTRTSLMYVIPEAAQYSMRTGEAIYLENDQPERVVWAVGRKRHQNFPPAHWAPKEVIDLNYGLDSPGLEYAQKVGAQYISGELMFKVQAQEQREFWTKQRAADSSS